MNTFRKLSFFAVFTLVLTLTASSVFARAITDDDKKFLTQSMTYMAAMADIMDKGIEDPQKCLDALDKYVTENEKALKEMGTKMDAIDTDLDPAEKEKWEQLMMESKEFEKFMNSMMAFAMKHGEDEKVAKRMDEIFSKMEEKKDEAPKAPVK